MKPIPTPLVSVVIPAYNAEKYLDECLQSVAKQDYEPLEILVVDDGSTDSTRDVVGRWEARDPRIRLVAKPHEGLPMTRRRGIDAATGVYIQHLDADDLLCEGAISALVARAETTGAQMVCASHLTLCLSGEVRCSKRLNFDRIDPLEYLAALYRSEYRWSVMMHFCRRDFYYACEVEVQPTISMCEDGILITQLLMHNPHIVSLDQPICCYRRTRESMTNDSAKKQQRVRAMRAAGDWMRRYLGHSRFAEHYNRELELRLCAFSIYYMWQGDYSTARSDMRHLAEQEARYPGLASELKLSRQLYRIVGLYSRAKWLGDLAMSFYVLKCKLRVALFGQPVALSE